MAKRFEQFCPIAHALDLVGERWSLLIVRELMQGPRRYTDLGAGLPGIGTNILAARLRTLEEGGIVHRRRLPPPAASTVYELTEYGTQLAEPMYALARWGIRSLGPPGPGDELAPGWGLNAFPALFDPTAAGGLTEIWVLRIDGDVFTVRLVDGALGVEVGETSAADLDLATDSTTFWELASGELDPRDAVADGRLEVQGDDESLVRCFRVFSFAPREQAELSPPLA